MKHRNRVTEQSDNYGYEDMNAQPMIDNQMIYRKKKESKPVITEDSDHYGYNDSNSSPPIETTGVAPYMGITFRKRKKNKAKIIRKPVKKCKCKK
jgi:hypothetical protein